MFSQECSYGFRPYRNAQQALRRVAQIITCEHTQFVVDADIKGFFDNVDHDWIVINFYPLLQPPLLAEPRPGFQTMARVVCDPHQSPICEIALVI